MFIESPINYMGSKYKLLPYLIKLFPKKTTFYDVFTGGGSVYMNVAALYDRIIANDYIADLIEIHKRLKDSEFVEQAAELSRKTKNSQEAYLELREHYNTSSNPAALLALIWSCNSNMMRFNQELKFNQTWGKRCFNDNTRKKWGLYKQQSCSNVCFENKHFGEYAGLNDKEAFVYLDPPYSNTEAGYNVFWSNSAEAELISMVKGFIQRGVAFGLSGVLNEKANRVYDEISQEPISIFYFGDMYQKISKKARTNVEYYITNVHPGFEVLNDVAID